jgi:hypothetical protein
MELLGMGVEDYVLINISRNCLDSALVLNAALKYRDTVGTNRYEIARPVQILRLYNSDKNFHVGEALPNDKKLNSNCLVSITFGYFDRPNHYVFYNDKGDVIYSGNKWLKR